MNITIQMISQYNGVLTLDNGKGVCYRYRGERASLDYALRMAKKHQKKPNKLYSIFEKCLGKPTKVCTLVN